MIDLNFSGQRGSKVTQAKTLSVYSGGKAPALPIRPTRTECSGYIVRKFGGSQSRATYPRCSRRASDAVRWSGKGTRSTFALWVLMFAISLLRLHNIANYYKIIGHNFLQLCLFYFELQLWFLF